MRNSPIYKIKFVFIQYHCEREPYRFSHLLKEVIITFVTLIFKLVERDNHEPEAVVTFNNSWLLFLFFSISHFLQGLAYRDLRKEMLKKV